MADQSINVIFNFYVTPIPGIQPLSSTIKSHSKSFTASDIAKLLHPNSKSKNPKYNETLAEGILTKLTKEYGDQVKWIDFYQAIVVHNITKTIQIHESIKKNTPSKAKSIITNIQSTINSLQGYETLLSRANTGFSIAKAFKKLSNQLQEASPEEDSGLALDLDEMEDIAFSTSEFMETAFAFAGPLATMALSILNLILAGASIVERIRDSNWLQIIITNNVPGTKVEIIPELNVMQGVIADQQENAISHTTIKGLQATQQYFNATVPSFPDKDNLVGASVVMYFLPPRGLLSAASGTLNLKYYVGDRLVDTLTLRYSKTTVEEFHYDGKSSYQLISNGVPLGELGYNGADDHSSSFPNDPKTEEIQSSNPIPGTDNVYINMKLVLQDLQVSAFSTNYGYVQNTLFLTFQNQT